MKIQLPQWEENENLYRLKLQDMIDEVTKKGLQILSQNGNAQEYFGTQLTTKNLYDAVIGISNVQIRLYKIEAQREYPITWAEVAKNSGGEGQNPLYVALLASFAQAYKIDLKPGLIRNPTIRLVVLDEAFSKMDAEKVASCIQLIRGLGFQALISATNDKIQNYLETVDKIFVFANPNKKSISIQEFEKKEFRRLREDLEDEEEGE